ncbi:19448_t:CDS:2, partial [Racocetra fulgida]
GETSKNEEEPCEIFAMAYKVEEIETSIATYQAINVLVNVAQNDHRAFWRLLHAEILRINEFKFTYSGFSTKALELRFNQDTNLLTTSTKF